MEVKKKNLYWTFAYWILFICWIIGAALYMARYNGGFLTNYLSDVAFPPWLYIYIRGLRTDGKELPNLVLFKNWFALTPERAALSIFMVGALSEFKTMIWSTGPITGTYDPYDILAYAIGILICYLVDKFS